MKRNLVAASLQRWLSRVSVLALLVSQPASARPPNVVFILADDLGWSDVGCYGADLHETPNIDRLAREGVRFTQAYAMPVCSPSRASILTGRHAARLHLTIWREGALGVPHDQPLVPPPTIADLPSSEVTIAEVLKGAGFLTFHVGKWHLGDAAHSPETQGFDLNIGGTHWGAPAAYFYPFRGPSGSAGEFRYVPGLLGKPGDFLDDRLTDEALKLIGEAGDRPFFLNLCFHVPHTPIEGKAPLVEHYRGKLKSGLHHQNPGYAAMVQTADDNVGRILAELDQRKLTDQTLVIFASDNGGYLGTNRGLVVTDNAPLRSGKGSVYEGGIRVPLIVRLPGLTARGETCAEPVMCTDFFPTIVELCAGGHAQPAPAGPLDGLSLVPLLKQPQSHLQRDALFFHYPHYYHAPPTTPVSAVRLGDWKLVEFFQDNHVELYSLRDDPGEHHDLAAAQPERATQLRTRLHDWWKEVGAQLPQPNPGCRPKPQKASP
jgi:arylsulfatase A-like enzyme